MVNRRTLEKQIKLIEGFDTRIKQQDGSEVPPGSQFKPYTKLFRKGSKQNWSIQERKDNRFASNYEGFAVSILRGDGRRAIGQMLLRNVRKSYYEE